MNNTNDLFSPQRHLVGVNDQKNGRVILCDLDAADWSDDRAVVREYSHGGGGENFGFLAGIKFRDCPYYGGKVLIYCFPSKARVLSFETQEILFETSYAGTNPHSVEILPDGTLFVASSSDGRAFVYAPGEKMPSHEVEFTMAHGILWDPKRQWIWVDGEDMLGAYTLEGTKTEPRLCPAEGKLYKTPGGAVHDLAPVYGDEDSLFVTCLAGIVKFDKNTETFFHDYPGGDVGRTISYAPGCGNFKDGTLAFTAVQPHNIACHPWCTNEIQYCLPSGEHIVRKIPKDAYYKLRVFNFDYQ